MTSRHNPSYLLLAGTLVTTLSLTACGGSGSSGTSAVAGTSSTGAVVASAKASTSTVLTSNGRQSRLPHWTATWLQSHSSTGGSTLAGTGTTSTSTGTTSTSGTKTSSGSTGSSTSTTGSTTGSTGSSASGSTSTSPGITRPSYNTGTGLFVLNGKLYDGNGHEFRIRGVNRVHWDSPHANAGIVASGANAVRWLIDFSQPAGNNVSLIQAQSIQNKQIPIIGNWTATCSSDPAALQSAVSTWVSQAASWTSLNKYMIVNIANEWGPANSTTWRDSYISAIANLRSAGYAGPILIDSGNCGQDQQDLVQYSAAVFNSDPQKNVIFALHVYGNSNDTSATIQSIKRGNPTVVTLSSTAAIHPFTSGFTGSNNSYSGVSAYQVSGVQGMTQVNGMQASSTNVGGTPGSWTITLNVDSTNWPAYTGGGTVVDYWGNYAMIAARLEALSQSTGAAYIIGEFGPGKNIGPSPTLTTPSEIISAAEANNVGWLAWAWDDNDLASCQADNLWFSMTYNCGAYTAASDLTIFGQTVVLNPVFGLATSAKRATSF